MDLKNRGVGVLYTRDFGSKTPFQVERTKIPLDLRQSRCPITLTILAIKHLRVDISTKRGFSGGIKSSGVFF